MEDFFTKLGLNAKTTVGVSVSSNNQIEMIYVDKTTRSISKYASRELRYNNAIREIIDYDEMTGALLELFKELNLVPNQCNVVLNLPNVHFAFTNLPLILSDDQVTSAIASEVEQLYLFKRHDPVISWNTIDESKDSDKRYIVYTAIQESVLSNIRDVFEDLGAKLIAIENSHSSMLKGIQYSKIVEEEIANGEPFNILLITSNSYAIFCLKGGKLLDYYEEPLAIKSFTDDEAYLAISSAAGSTLDHYPTKNLLLISETNDVSAELLADKINFDGAIKYLDRNKYSDKSFMNIDFSILQSYIPLISLESVGAATYNYEPYSVKFNFLSDVMDSSSSSALTLTILGKEIEIDKKALLPILGAITGALIIFFIIIGLSLKYFSSRLTSDLESLTLEQQTLEKKIKESKISVDVADIYTISQQIFVANKQSLGLFRALSAEIPPEVWINSFYSNADGEVIIIGKTTATEHIYRFFKGLRKNDPDIFLGRLELDYDEALPLTNIKSNDNLYTFEVDSTKNKKKVEETSGLNPLIPGTGSLQNGVQPSKPSFFPMFGQSQTPQTTTPIAPAQSSPPITPLSVPVQQPITPPSIPETPQPTESLPTPPPAQ